MIPLEDFPAINASINGTIGLVLLCGYACIRAKKVTAHKTCMITAICLSVLFLTCYLYYHYHHGATRFPGQGWIRLVYFTILISHTILAASVFPLAIITVYRALKGQFERHKKIARWTLPIWLYVSVTGVAVYWMLYRM